MNKVAAFALRRKNSILSMSEKMFCPPQPLRLVWITPACAGKSRFHSSKAPSRRDHPRVCGEKSYRPRVMSSAMGSPPRMRGKAWGRCCPDRLRWDHPRVCGEKHCTSTPIALVSGSPPRMRGKAVEMKLAGTVHGITPACAGKSQSPFPLQRPARDHPRMCGEKSDMDL